MSSLIGRVQDISEVTESLAGWRLVTLTGAPGIGKTRLALGVAGGPAGEAEAVCFGDLTSLTDPGLVAGAVAAALSLQEAPGRGPTEALLAYLHERDALLVLDNCEHLLGACGRLVDELLHGCPRLRVLATSREPLGIVGERVWRVPALSLPDPGCTSPTPEAAQSSPAVALFVARATEVQPGFTLDDHLAAAITAICRRLDGIPLAIELAAARVEMLTPAEIAWRLDDRFALLRSTSPVALPRHHSLGAALDWSHDLLSDAERALLRRLSVFVGGFELEAAEAVCGGDELQPGDVLDGLSRLVARSLVVADVRNEVARYHLLETIRAYAVDRLEAAGEQDSLREAHARVFLELAERAEPELTGSSQQHWLGHLERERSNLRCALEWSLGNGRADWALRMAGALTIFWRVRCHFSEGRDLLAAAILAAGNDHSPAQRAKALWGHGFLTMMAGDLAGALTPLEESLDLYRELGDRQGCARALLILANTLQLGDHPAFLAMLEESAELAYDTDDLWCWAHARAVAGWEHLSAGELRLARPLFEECIAAARLADDQQSLRIGLLGLGSAALEEGDLPSAEALLEEAAAVGRRLGESYATGTALEQLGQIALGRGEYDRARELLEEAVALIERAAHPRELGAAAARLARAVHACGDRDEAHRRFDHALELAGASAAARLLQWMAELAADEGDHDSSRRLLHQAQEVARSHGDQSAIAAAQHELAQLTRGAGDLPRAARLHDDALEFRSQVGDTPGIAASLDAAAGLAAMGARHRHAAELMGAADALWQRMGLARLPWERARHEADVAIVREALAADEFEAALDGGRGLSVDEMVALARRRQPLAGRPAKGWLSLTETEQRVAELAAEGRTNRELAECLFMSLSTVKAHLASAFAKLGVTRRTQLAWEVARRPGGRSSNGHAAPERPDDGGPDSSRK